MESHFGKTFIFLTKLAWNSRITLPMIISAVFMAMDFRMQVEFNVHTEGIMLNEDYMEPDDDNVLDEDVDDFTLNDTDDSWQTLDTDDDDDDDGIDDDNIVGGGGGHHHDNHELFRIEMERLLLH